MTEIPLDIADTERLVRGICSPYHISSNGRLKPAAFDAPAEMDEVSVVRHEYVGADDCKRHGKTLTNEAEGKLYKGLAVICARSVRLHGAAVVDSRTIFMGHADIKHGHRKSRLEPPAPEVVALLNQRNKELAKAAHYFADPDPHGGDWTGEALLY